MTRTTATDSRNSRQAVARLLLSLLLLIAPLLANAAGMPMMNAGADATTPASAQMPCHSGEPQPTQSPMAAQAEGCPHCTGDAPATQCHCCGHAAPAGLGFQAAIHPSRHADGVVPRGVETDSLPDSPGDRLYRPPIIHS